MIPANYNYYYGIPSAMSQIFDKDPKLRDYYFSLPDETQQAILREDVHSEKDFYDCVEKLKLKE